MYINVKYILNSLSVVLRILQTIISNNFTPIMHEWLVLRAKGQGTQDFFAIFLRISRMRCNLNDVEFETYRNKGMKTLNFLPALPKSLWI